MISHARECEGDLWSPGEPGYGRAKTLRWSYDPAYPVANIVASGTKPTPLSEWKDWFLDEIRGPADNGSDATMGEQRGWDDLLVSEIRDPVVIHEVDGVGYLWGGNHRIGATAARGGTAVKAIVGRK